MTMPPVMVMCRDPHCPSRRNCARHAAGGAAPVGDDQPYFAAGVRSIGAGDCTFFRAAGNADLFEQQERA